MKFLFNNTPLFSSTLLLMLTTLQSGEAYQNEVDQPINQLGQKSYGIDVSFPTHYGISTNYAWLPHNEDPDNNDAPKQYEDMPVQVLGNKKEFYDEFLEGCKKFYGKRAQSCVVTEEDRLAMSVRQPQSMLNFTDTGFKKIRAPKELMNILTNYWNTHNKNKKEEKWNAGNTYTNHWASPTYMVSVEDTGFRGGGRVLKDRIWNAARETIEEWTGQDLSPTSLYGIRVYTEGAVLAPHVDRLPLVSSCIINVAQDVDEDWPLEVYGRDGLAYNVTMKPGDMVLYESHSLIHGRPFPLKGRYYANIFIHFEPRGISSNHGGMGDYAESDLPPYILEDSPEEKKWKQEHSGGWTAPAAAAAEVPEAHFAAANGDIDLLKEIAAERNHLMLYKDQNGWQPIHEAARGGHKDAVELLIKHGADINERTNNGYGGTPLYLAASSHGQNHELVAYLRNLGAVYIEPEL